MNNAKENNFAFFIFTVNYIHPYGAIKRNKGFVPTVSHYIISKTVRNSITCRFFIVKLYNNSNTL